MVRCLPLRCDWPTERWPTQWMATSPNESSAHTVDGRNPAPVDKYSLSHSSQGLIHPSWCRISSTTVSQVAWTVKLKFLQKRYLAWLYKKNNNLIPTCHFLRCIFWLMASIAPLRFRRWRSHIFGQALKNRWPWLVYDERPPFNRVYEISRESPSKWLFFFAEQTISWFVPPIMVMWKTPEHNGTSGKTPWFGAKK